MQRVLTFVEQRHYLSLARNYGEAELARRITDVNAFKIRLTNMIRSQDYTSKILLQHYAKHFIKDSPDGFSSLICNIMFLRNTMSKEVVKMCANGAIPWVQIENGLVTTASKDALDGLFLQLSGKIFFQHVEPMRSRAKSPRTADG